MTTSTSQPFATAIVLSKGIMANIIFIVLDRATQQRHYAACGRTVPQPYISFGLHPTSQSDQSVCLEYAAHDEWSNACHLSWSQLDNQVELFDTPLTMVTILLECNQSPTTAPLMVVEWLHATKISLSPSSFLLYSLWPP
jgi:hypothetical protein